MKNKKSYDMIINSSINFVKSSLLSKAKHIKGMQINNMQSSESSSGSSSDGESSSSNSQEEKHSSNSK